MAIKKTKFKCEGCGKDRPCILEINQEETMYDYLTIDSLKCVLDETNQTGYDWKEIDRNEKD